MSGNANGNPIIANGPNSGGAGEGIIVGMVDSGIWPENPSFSDRDADGKLVYQQLPGWHGKCVPGEFFTASNCNQKLISARWYGAGFGGEAGVKAELPYEIWSARDVDGHGSHTSSTAAGNFGVTAIANGNNLGQVSGMAPRARIATYKVCWGIAPEGGCFPSDSVAAIDQAVADGVDVINFSISGSTTSFLDPVEVAFLFAADAGVFVAASAGNSGPRASTVAHNSPWLTTVAAGTKDRIYQAIATLGNGAQYVGVGLGAAVPSSPLILSTGAGVSGADATAARLCFSAEWAGAQVLDPAKVAGKIVVCDRGTNDRVDKSKAVLEAGGVGMILLNTSPNTLNADLHSVPTVHLQDTYRPAILAYGATPSPTASLGAGTLVPAVAPTVASFSSRGPASAGGGDLLKPDIMAPGVGHTGGLFALCRRTQFQLPVRYVDVEPAHGGHRRAHEAGAPELVAGHDQVSADDQRLADHERRHGDPGHVRSITARARWSPMARSIRAWSTTRASTTGWRSCAAPASSRPRTARPSRSTRAT